MPEAPRIAPLPSTADEVVGDVSLPATAAMPAAPQWEVVERPSAAGALRGYRGAVVRGTITDDDLIAWYLQDKAPAATTRASYEAHLLRLQWFCRHQGLPSVRRLQREDFDALTAYLAAPPAEHVMKRSVGRDAPDWRPFRGPLQLSSISLAATVIRGFYAWLAEPDIGALPSNPLGAKRIKAVRKTAAAQQVERFFTPQTLAYIDQAVEAMPVETLAERRQRARARWVIALAVHTGLRASEIAAARASMLKVGRDNEWSLHIVRKGNLESRVPILPQVLQAHRDYLAAFEIAATRDSPLVLSVKDGQADRPLGRTTIWRIVRDVAQLAAGIARAAGDLAETERLEIASTHWLRHTFGTALLDSGADLRTVRDLMDHASIATTSRYAHVEDKKRREDLARMGEQIGAGGKPS